MTQLTTSRLRTMEKKDPNRSLVNFSNPSRACDFREAYSNEYCEFQEMYIKVTSIEKELLICSTEIQKIC